MHLPGLIVGVGLGLFYLAVIGPRAATPMDMLVVAAAGLAGAIITGAILGRWARPQAPDWAQQQTDLSTTVALNAATGVVVWAGIGWLVTGRPPNYAAFLPLWFIVQYLGHVFAFLAARRKWSVPLQPEAVAPSVTEMPVRESPAPARVGTVASVATPPGQATA